MKFKGSHITQASGSIAGVTYSHNAGGQYIRARSVPTNPQTEQQVAVRNFMAQLASAWNNILTAAQRAGWKTYAENTPLTDALGDPINVGAIGMYVRSNVPRLQATLTRIDAAPGVFNLGEFTQIVPGDADVSSVNISLAFTNTDAWALEAGSAMLVYLSRPQNVGLTFFKGPYRFAGKIAGATPTAPTSPATITLPFPVALGQSVFGRVQVTRADGRLSAQQTFQVGTQA